MEVVFPETNMKNNAVPMLTSKKRRLAAYNNNTQKRQKCLCRVKEKPKIIEEIIRHNEMKEQLEAIYHRFYY